MKKQPVTEIILLCMASNFVSSHREHKVHNIVLYPDKHSWCNTTPIKQVVAYPGCSSVEIDNNVCVGACFSYSIPRTVPSAPGELIKPYCDSCQPSTVTWKHVTLECGGDETESSEVMQKSVQIITNCSCSTCDLGDDATTAFSASGDGEIGPGHHKPSLLDDPMLMFRTQKKPSGASEHTGSNGANVASGNFSLITNDPVMNERLLLLLRQLGKDEDAEKLDKVVLRKLLRQVEGADHKVNQATLEEFVKNVEHRDHIKVNLEKLKHVLARLENDEMALTHHENGSPESSTHRHHHHGSSGHGENVMSPVVHHHRAVADPGDADSPTLDVAPHHFKPAIEGSELSYHDNLLQPSDADDPDNTAREKNDDKDEEF